MTSNNKIPTLFNIFYMDNTIPLIVNLGYLILDFRDCIREYEHHQAVAVINIHALPFLQNKTKQVQFVPITGNM